MRSTFALGLLSFLLVLPACTPPSGAATDPSGASAAQSAGAPSASAPDPSASASIASASASPESHPLGGMANPAAVNCIKSGGHLAIRRDPAGDTSACVFPDGSECEEWAFFRHECSPKTK